LSRLSREPFEPFEPSGPSEPSGPAGAADNGVMRALLPHPVDDIDLHAHYAAGWTDHGGIRANMVASVDGAAAADGLSAGLQTPGDNRVFAALRDLADVVLVGAATAEAEGYRPVPLDGERATLRRQYGFQAPLPIALVTRNLDLDLSGPLFRDAGQRPLIITTRRADAGPAAAVADVIVCGDDVIDFGEARRQLAARGLTRVLCEGGPTLLGRVAAAGELDELCLSITPLLIGPGATRVIGGPPWPTGPRALELRGQLEENGALFLRYSIVRE
jgi:riboflavin biosynthesis pyrimidine reductase